MSGRPKRVLFIHHLDIVSPYQNTVPHYLASKVSEDHSVHVICRQLPDRRADEYPLDGVVLHDINTGNIPLISGLLFVLASSIYALGLGLRYRYDVVYAFQKTIVQGFLASMTGGGRFVIGLQSVPVRQTNDFQESHGMDRSLSQRLAHMISSLYASVLSMLIERASSVICLTEGIRDLTETVYDIDLSDAHVIEMGVDVDTFSPARSDGGTDPSEPLTVVYVGTVGVNRGIGHLIEAIGEFDGDVELLIAGSGTDDHMSKLKGRAREVGAEDQIQWLGFVPHEEVPELLQESDVAVSPLRDIESFQVSFPAKVLEYLAAGCTVVATDIPSHRRMIQDGHNGYLYDGSKTELVEILSECSGHREQGSDIGQEARNTAEEYSWDNVIAKHEAVMFGSS